MVMVLGHQKKDMISVQDVFLQLPSEYVMNPTISPSLSGDESCMFMLCLILKHGKEKYAMYIKMTFQFKCPSRGSFSVAMLGFRMVLFKHVVFNTCFCARGHRYMKHLACATTY